MKWVKADKNHHKIGTKIMIIVISAWMLKIIKHCTKNEDFHKGFLQ